MTYLEVLIPVYEKDKWGILSAKGKIRVSSDVDNLSEGYAALEKQIDQLLAELNASGQLAKSVAEMQREIEERTRILNNLTKSIERATQHYEDMKAFLEDFGVDVDQRRLTFNRRFLPPKASTAEVEVVSDDDCTNDEF